MPVPQGERVRSREAIWPLVISTAALCLALIAFGHVATLVSIAALVGLYAAFAAVSDEALRHGGSLGFAIGILAGCTLIGLMLGAAEVIGLGLLVFALALVVRAQLIRDREPDRGIGPRPQERRNLRTRGAPPPRAPQLRRGR